MQIPLAYGRTGLTISLPDAAKVTVLQPKHVDGLPDDTQAIRDAVRHPIASAPLSELVAATATVGLVFSDITRPTPNHRLLPAIRAELAHLPDAQIVLFNATGTHRANTDAELRGMLGDELVDRYRIVQNDPHDRDAHALIGTTTSGNDIWIDRAFLHCTSKILTGFIEPHFFAGFSGGGKAIMPGMALLETVQRNHNAANMDSPRARWGITWGNPVWEEVREAARMANPTFLVNVTLNRDKQITRVFAGEMDAAHAAGCAFVQKSAMVAVDAPFDIVIVTNSGYPLDLNLYQSVKGMSAAAQIVRDGGSIILAAECWDGIPEQSPYGRLLKEATDNPSLLATIRTPGFHYPEMWQAQIQALVGEKAEVYVYSHHLSDTQIRNALLTPCGPSIDATVARLCAKYGPEATIGVLPEGPQTVPYLVQ